MTVKDGLEKEFMIPENMHVVVSKVVKSTKHHFTNVTLKLVELHKSLKEVELPKGQ